MTDAIDCPKCQDVLDVPIEFRGQSVRCGSCGLVFTAPLEGSPETQQPPVVEVRSRAPRYPGSADSTLDLTAPQPRSNAFVWLMLLGTLIVGSVVFFLLGRGLMSLMIPKMHDFASVEGAYQVTFPGTGPKVSPPTTENDRTTYSVESQGKQNNSRYTVKYFDLTGKRAVAEPDNTLTDAIRAELGPMPQGFVESGPQSVLHQGQPAVDVFWDGGPLGTNNTVIRGILAGKRVYLVIVRGQVRPELSWVQKFYLSFKLTDPKFRVKDPAK